MPGSFIDSNVVLYRLSTDESKLIVAAAQEAGCDTVYSEDLQHGQVAGPRADRRQPVSRTSRSMSHLIGRQGAGRRSVRRGPLPSQPCHTTPRRRLRLRGSSGRKSGVIAVRSRYPRVLDIPDFRVPPISARFPHEPASRFPF